MTVQPAALLEARALMCQHAIDGWTAAVFAERAMRRLLATNN